MRDGDSAAGIGLRDVRDTLIAIEDDLPIRPRIVVYLHETERGERRLRVKAQACDSEGRPLSAVPFHSHDWPHNRYKTLTALMYDLLVQLYGSVDYMTWVATEERSERP